MRRTIVFAKVDICDRRPVAEAFETFAPDQVIHLAAESHVDRSITGSDPFIQTNVVGTFSHAEAARAYWQALPGAAAGRVSFPACLDRRGLRLAGGRARVFEETPYDPSSPYSASKAASDHLVSAYQNLWLARPDLELLEQLRPLSFPGEAHSADDSQRLHGKPLPVYGEGPNVRDWLYVEDHARALDRIVSRGGSARTYNIGGHNERRNIDVVQRICAMLDECSPRARADELLITYVTDRPGHDRRYAIDATKLERELGWRALRRSRADSQNGALVSRQRVVVAPAEGQSLRRRASRRGHRGRDCG